MNKMIISDQQQFQFHIMNKNNMRNSKQKKYKQNALGSSLQKQKNNESQFNFQNLNDNNPQNSLNKPIAKTTKLKTDQSIIYDQSWKNHMNKQCYCEICICNKHLCQLNPIKLNLRPKTSYYKSQFKMKKPYQNLQIHKPQIPNSNKKFPCNSQYKNQYCLKNTIKPQKIIPINNLNISGPTYFETSYGKQFNNKTLPFQRFLYKQNPTIIQNLHINGQSSYKCKFKWNPIVKTNSFKYQDTLHFDNIFYGDTSYKTNFIKYPLQQKMEIKKKEKYQPTMALPFQTHYEKEYQKYERRICPAQIDIRNKQKKKNQ